MNIPGVFQREKRYSSQMYHPLHQSVTNYWTAAFQKREMKYDFNEDLFLNNIHLIPDPLKKNLADSLFTNEMPENTEKRVQQDQKMTLSNQEVPLGNAPKQTTAFGGIGNFFSGVMNVLTSVMFRSRETSHYDCFDVDGQGKGWQNASTDVQDKNGQASDYNSYDGVPNPNVSSEMNFDSRAAVTGCERKLNQVLHLLAPKQTSSPVWVRKRPKKEFVEPGSVEENFEDAYSPEDFCSLPSDSYIEYCSPLQYHCEDLYETAAQKTKLYIAPVEENTDMKDNNKINLGTKNYDILLDQNSTQLEKDSMLFGNNIIQLEDNSEKLGMDDVQAMQLEKENVQRKEQNRLEKSNLNMEQKTENKSVETTETEPLSIKNQLVSSCEDKLSKLKALLKLKREIAEAPYNSKASPSTSPKPAPKTKTADKHFKNPNRRCNKRSKTKLKCHIEDDLVFANEINVGTPPSAENSPMQHSVSLGDYFDEISGRFRTASTGSDDSFQIVFTECHSVSRTRKSSDCDSEDSFIVFEDSPESCYVSNDVIESDSESEMSDSGCGITCKLAHSLTRTVSNLADDTLYESEDEVDFGMEKTDNVVEERTGLLLDEKKKQLRKSQPPKKVHFSPAPPKVHVLRVWAFAARQARAGHWERYAVDRERFKRRITDAEMALSWVLKPQHRSRVMFQRFMPWWNQLKRKELAEKKEKEEEEKKRKEEERRREAEPQEEGKRKEELQEEVNKVVEGNQEHNKESKKEEERRSQTKTTQDVNVNENEDKKINANKHEENIKTNRESEFKEEIYSQNESVIKEQKKNSMGDNKQYFYDNSLNDSGKVSTDLIIQNDALTKKIQDLEAADTIEIVSS